MANQQVETAHGPVSTAFDPVDSSVWLTVNHGGVLRADDREIARFVLLLHAVETSCSELGAGHPLNVSARSALGITESRLMDTALWTELDGNDLGRLSLAIERALHGEVVLPERMRSRIERLDETVRYYQNASGAG